MKRSGLFSAVLCGLLWVASPALSADLDETSCEAGPIAGVWHEETSTCTAAVIFNLEVLNPFTVPAGVTLGVIGDVDGPTAVVTNFGTISVGGIWHNHGSLHNYGIFTVNALHHDNVFHHCGSTLTAASDDPDTVTNLDCSVVTAVSADPTSGSAPLTVSWTVTVLNDGDDPLSAVEVALSTDSGATTFQTLSGPPASGDDGDGILGVGETWVYLVERVETADLTLTATVSGEAPSGLVVTVPDDPEAQADASVTVAAAATTTSTSTSTTVAPTSSSSAPTDVAPVTLPLTGSGASDVGVIAVSLLALGGLVVAATRREEETD